MSERERWCLKSARGYFMGYFGFVEIGDLDEAFAYASREKAHRDLLGLHKMGLRDPSIPAFEIRPLPPAKDGEA